MKMLTTQISGLLQRIVAINEESIEETARLLAQATVGKGRVIIIGLGEMTAISINALEGAEPFLGAVPYEEGMMLNTEDRVWIISRSSSDSRAINIARKLSSQFIPFAATATEQLDDSNELAELATTYIQIGLLKGLLPGDNNNRIVQPHALATLFIYEAVKIAYDEMLAFD